MKTYRGTRGTCGVVVTVRIDDGDDRPLPGPAGEEGHFDWGFGCSEQSSLALSILTDQRGREFAARWYLLFASEVLRNLPHVAWSLTEVEINEHLERITAGAPDESTADAGDDEDVLYEPADLFE